MIYSILCIALIAFVILYTDYKQKKKERSNVLPFRRHHSITYLRKKREERLKKEAKQKEKDKK